MTETNRLSTKHPRRPISYALLRSVSLPYQPPCHMLPSRWKPPTGLPSHTCATAGVLQLLYDQYDMDRACPNGDLTDFTVDMLAELALSIWHHASVVDKLAADAKACGVRVGVSNIHNGGRGVFTERRFEVGEFLMSFCGQIVYSDLMPAAKPDDKERQEIVYCIGLFKTTALRWGERAFELTTGCRMLRPGWPT